MTKIFLKLRQRFGFPFTILVYLVRFLRKISDISIAKVGSSRNLVKYPLDNDYENRMIDFEQFGEATGKSGDQFEAAFSRGDTCLASFKKDGDELAGYNFFTTLPTTVNDQIEFIFSHDYMYSYAAYTFFAHRNKGLSPSRWTSHREWRIAKGHSPHTIHYIEIHNTSSLISGDNKDTLILGYTGYLKLWGRIWCWRSAGCKKAGAGFRVRV